MNELTQPSLDDAVQEFLERQHADGVSYPSAPAQRHSATSVAAARSMEHILPSLRTRVLRFIERCGPVTDEEIAVTLGLNPNTARPRRIELVADGLVMAAPETRPTAAGRSATAWVATP